MKKTLKGIFKYKFTILMLAIVGFLTTYFVVEFVVNNNFSYYEFTIESENPEEYFKADYISSQIKKVRDYNTDIKLNKKDLKTISFTDSSIDGKGIGEDLKLIENEDGTYTVKIPLKYFQTTPRTKPKKLDNGYSFTIEKIDKCRNVVKGIYDSGVDGIECANVKVISDISIVDYNRYGFLYSSITAVVVVVGAVLVFYFLLKDKPDDYLNDISDNQFIFKSPFSKNYWLSAKNVFSSVKNLAVIAILFALMMASKAITLPSGFGALGLSFTYLFFAVIGMIYGPYAGLVIGFFSDVLGFFLFPTGYSFFPGYTLDAMLAGFTYAIFFYKTKITFTKCLYSRTIVNLFVNVLLGSIWWSIINNYTMDGFLTYMVVISLPKNLIYLLPQSIILFLIIKALSRPLAAFNMIDTRVADNITLF